MDRLSQRNRDTSPVHSKAAIAILRFTAALMRLADANQRFHASPSQLDDLSAIRDELQDCKSPMMVYGDTFVHSEGEIGNHWELVLALTNVIIELKLRNSGNGQRDIMWEEIEEIRRLTNPLDKCRKQTTFYR